MMPGLPDNWLDDGRPTAEHLAEARELAARRCAWWWRRWTCKEPVERVDRCMICTTCDRMR